MSGLLRQAGFAHQRRRIGAGIVHHGKRGNLLGLSFGSSGAAESPAGKTDPETRSAIRQEVIRVLNQKFGEGPA